MTRRRLIALHQNRARLIGRARSEREHLAATVGSIESSLSWVNVVQKGVDQARRYPLVVLVAVALLVALRPRRALKLAASGWWLWRAYQRARRIWALASTLAAGAATSTP